MQITELMDMYRISFIVYNRMDASLKGSGLTSHFNIVISFLKNISSGEAWGSLSFQLVSHSLHIGLGAPLQGKLP